MFLGTSRVLFCCCCESQMGYLKKRKAMGVVHFACIIMFNVKHPLYTCSCLQDFNKNTFFKAFLCVCVQIDL